MHHLDYDSKWEEGFAYARIPTPKTNFGCGGGVGIIRKEVWVNEKGEVVRHNRAFFLPHLFGLDNGRVLRFDNAHVVYERHYMGKATPTVFKDSPATAESFYREVGELRRSYEDQGFLRRI